jgi:hypothetical protein
MVETTTRNVNLFRIPLFGGTPLKDNFLLQGHNRGTFVLEVFIFHLHANWFKATNGSDVKMKDHKAERARIAAQEGKNIWVRVEEGERFSGIICWSIFEMQEDFLRAKIVLQSSIFMDGHD